MIFGIGKQANRKYPSRSPERKIMGWGGMGNPDNTNVEYSKKNMYLKSQRRGEENRV